MQFALQTSLSNCLTIPAFCSLLPSSSWDSTGYNIVVSHIVKNTQFCGTSCSTGFGLSRLKSFPAGLNVKMKARISLLIKPQIS